MVSRFSSVPVLLGRAEHLFGVVDRLLLLETDGVPPILTGNVVIEPLYELDEVIPDVVGVDCK